MASEKQARMLYARALEAGVKPDYNAYLQLENGDIDKKLAEFKQIKNSDAYDQATTTPKENSEYSDIRAGLAMKLLIQHSSIIRCLNEPENFVETAERLYFLLDKTEAAIKRDCQGRKEPLA